MTDLKDILCPIRDTEPPYAYCMDSKGHRSKTRVLGRTYPSRGDYFTQLQCNENAAHKFKLDREGKVIDGRIS